MIYIFLNFSNKLNFGYLYSINIYHNKENHIKPLKN
jgi:hypothetical protein